MIDGLSRFQGLNDIYLAAEKEYAEARYENYIIKCRQVNEKLINDMFAITGDNGVAANGQKYQTHAKLRYIVAFFGKRRLLSPKVVDSLYEIKRLGNDYVHGSAKNLSNIQGMRKDAEKIHKKIEEELRWYTCNENKLRDFVKTASKDRYVEAKSKAENYQNASPSKQQQMEKDDGVSWWKIFLGGTLALVGSWFMFGKKE